MEFRLMPEYMEAIKAYPCFGMLCMPIIRNGKSEACFVIKDKASILLDTSPTIDTRCCVSFCLNTSVSVGVLLARIKRANGELGEIYESYFNYCPDSSKQMIDSLSIQNDVILLMFDWKGKNIRTVQLPNHLTGFFHHIQRQAFGKSWSMEEFELAKQEIKSRKTLSEMWLDLSIRTAQLN